MPTNAGVLHAKDKNRFEFILKGRTGILEYRVNGRLMNIHHTFVPSELRGQRVAAELAKAAFDYARMQKLKVVPTCSYIAAYAERHPEAAELL